MSAVVSETGLPVVHVDKAHWQKVDSGENKVLEYSIPAGEEFRLSIDGFNFPIPSGADFKAPNIIQIVTGGEGVYALAFDQNCESYMVNRETLVPMYGSPSFSGFRKGTTLVVAIGHLSPPVAGLPQPKFTVLWAGVVNFL